MKRILITPVTIPNVVVFLTGTKGVYSFYLNFLTETFVLNLCNFNIAESTNIVGTAFLQKRKYLQSFQF